MGYVPEGGQVVDTNGRLKQKEERDVQDLERFKVGLITRGWMYTAT